MIPNQLSIPNNINEISQCDFLKLGSTEMLTVRDESSAWCLRSAVPPLILLYMSASYRITLGLMGSAAKVEIHLVGILQQDVIYESKFHFITSHNGKNQLYKIKRVLYDYAS